MFKKYKRLTFHGRDFEKMDEVLLTLHGIMDTVGLSEKELFAMNTAIEAINSLMDAMINNNGKVEFD